jgi:hypothetical protein
MATVSPRRVASERFRREHYALVHLLEQIRARFRIGHHLEPGEHVSERLIDALVELRDHLGMMFALEESPVIPPDIGTLAPRLASHFLALRDEHRALFLELCRTIDYSEDAFCHHQLDDLLGRIERKFDEFQRHLQAHEERENSLLQQAFQDDIGVGD